MWTFDQNRAEAEEEVSFDEFEPRLKVCEYIGAIDPDLLSKLKLAFNYQDNAISAVGSYEIHVPQKMFTLSFVEFIDKLKNYFK